MPLGPNINRLKVIEDKLHNMTNDILEFESEWSSFPEIKQEFSDIGDRLNKLYYFIVRQLNACLHVPKS